jgi:hypothetical protein
MVVTIKQIKIHTISLAGSLNVGTTIHIGTPRVTEEGGEAPMPTPPIPTPPTPPIQAPWSAD